MPRLTIIVPAHNEEKRIENTLKRHISFFSAKKIDYDLLVVLNGCIDNTLEKVRRMASRSRRLRYINITESIGKGGAIKEGIKNSDADLVGFVDADCSVDPGEFYKLFRGIKGCDCAISSRYVPGSRILVKQPFQRTIASRAFNMIVRLLFLLPYHDTQCGAKIMARKPLLPFLGDLRITDWAFDVNLLYLLRRNGRKVKEIPIRWKDAPGSKLDLKKVSPRMLLSVLRLRMIYSPLSIFSKQFSRVTGSVTRHFKKGEENIFFSIIVPFRKFEGEVNECIEGCLGQAYPHFEVILLPDAGLKHIRFKSRKIRVIPTGSVRPSAKRNIGIENSKGSICAFIDSDAAPRGDWLEAAASAFLKDSSTGIIGGPNLDKKDATVLEKASGDILSSVAGAGKFALRYSEGNECSVEELPSCNLFARKNLLLKHSINFDETFLTAEDSKLCFDVRRAGAKVVYLPQLQVFHRRRRLFLPHLKQMWIYGRDKACLIRQQKVEQSLFYFLPSFFVLFNITGLTASFFSRRIGIFYALAVLFYLIIVAAASLKKTRRIPLVFSGTVLTHISYGLGFLHGLFRKVGN